MVYFWQAYVKQITHDLFLVGIWFNKEERKWDIEANSISLMLIQNRCNLEQRNKYASKDLGKQNVPSLRGEN